MDVREMVQTKRLKWELRLRQYQVVGLLQTLWCAGVKVTPDGGIGRLSNAEIAALIEWDGDPDKLVAALLKSGWLHEHATYRLAFHDWKNVRPVGGLRLPMVPQESVDDFARQLYNNSRRCGQRISKRQWAEVLDHFGFSCAFCLAKGVPLTIEHLTPVSKGGGNEVGNVVPACQPCNYSKKDRFPLEWFISRRSF